jgi:hypothetical protein
MQTASEYSSGTLKSRTIVTGGNAIEIKYSQSQFQMVCALLFTIVSNDTILESNGSVEVQGRDEVVASC